MTMGSLRSKCSGADQTYRLPTNKTTQETENKNPIMWNSGKVELWKWKIPKETMCLKQFQKPFFLQAVYQHE